MLKGRRPPSADVLVRIMAGEDLADVDWSLAGLEVDSEWSEAADACAEMDAGMGVLGKREGGKGDEHMLSGDSGRDATCASLGDPSLACTISASSSPMSG